jgi:tetratricopeptide (TPR) repeat protein
MSSLSDPESSSIRATTPLNHRRWNWSDIILRLLLLVLVALLVVEVTSKRWYEASLSSITRVIVETEEDPTGRSVARISELAPLAQGFCHQRPLYAGKSTYVEFLWLSVFKTYSIRIEHDDEDVALSLESGDYDQMLYSLVPPDVGGAGSSVVDIAESRVRGLPAGHPPTVMLELVSLENMDRRHQNVDLLRRELVRQAFLLSAREELQLPALDEALHELPPRQQEVQQLPFNVSVRSFEGGSKPIQVNVDRWKTGLQKRVAEFSLTSVSDSSLEGLVSECEQLARERFRTLLEGEGYTTVAGLSDPPADGAELSAVQLPGFGVVELCRELHRLHRQPGGSSGGPVDRLLRLSCVYAHLASTTGFAMDLLPIVCQARALLYAERAVVLQKSSTTIGNRAYVRALVGRHGAALDDLAEIPFQEILEPPAVWWPVIDAYCRDNLSVVDDGGLSPDVLRLKRHLQMLGLQHMEMVKQKYSRTLEQLHQTADGILADEPNHLLARMIRLQHPLIGEDRSSDAKQFTTMLEALIGQLQACPELPQTAVAVLGQPRHTLEEQVSVILALRDGLRGGDWAATTVRDPGWSLLAECLKEQVFWRAWIWTGLRHWWQLADWDTTHPQLLAATQGHYLANFIEGLGLDGEPAVEAYRQYDDTELGLRLHATGFAIGWVLSTSRQEPNVQSRLEYWMFRNGSPVAGDLKARHRMVSDGSLKDDISRQLIQVMPYSEMAQVSRIKNQWEQLRTEATAIEQQYAHAASVQSALAREYRMDMNDDAAERCLRRVIDLEPTHQAYRSLADIYLDREDLDEWLKLGQAALQLPASPEEPASTAGHIALGLMDRGLYQEALPYALTAAQGGLYWQLLCAADCCERLQDWEQAEAFRRQSGVIRKHDVFHWYLWCRRTKRGDLASARAALEPLLADGQEKENFEWILKSAFYELLEGRPESALALFVRAAENSSSNNRGYAAVHAALLSEELGIPIRRVRWLEALRKSRLERQDVPSALVLELQQAFSGDATRLNLVAAEWQIQTIAGTGYCTDFYYFLGQTCLLRGQQAEAIRYLQLAATSNATGNYNATLAAAALEKLGHPVGPRRIHEYPDDVAEALTWRDRSWEYHNERQFVRARMRLQRALSLRPDLAAIWMSSSNCWAWENDQARALADIEQALKLAPDVAEIHFIRGRLREKAGQLTDAVTDYERARELDYLDPALRVQLAWLRSASHDAALRDGEQAQKHARAIADSPLIDDWLKQAVLAAALAECGQFEEAARVNRESGKMAPYSERQRVDERQQLYEAGQPYRRPPPMTP